MRRACTLAFLGLVAPACATASPSAPAAAPRPARASVREAIREFWSEDEALMSRGIDSDEDLARRRRWMARFREMARCGDPAEEDQAYGALALLVTNLGNADSGDGTGREALPLFREWAARYPSSAELGESLWMLTCAAPEEAGPQVLLFLEGLSGSPAERVARGATAARADLLESLGRPGEATPLLEEILRRWPDSAEARTARLELKGRSLAPGTSAPDFALRDLDGREASLASLRGRVALLVFFSFG